MIIKTSIKIIKFLYKLIKFSLNKLFFLNYTIKIYINN